MNNETFPVTTPSLHDSITPLPALPPADSDHRGNGKIARLPKILRDQVNHMLDDGVPYKAIIEKPALKQLDPNRTLSDNEHRAIADIIDQVMEMPHPLWSAPAERSGDGALANPSAPTDVKTPSRCAEPISAEVSAIENPKSKF